MITDLTSSHICFKTFVTSRKETDIKYCFESQKMPTIPINAQHVNKDIETYVRFEVDFRIQKRSLRVKDMSLKDKIVSTLIEKADGMFLWVQLQLNNLGRHLLDKDIEQELENVPEGLNGTYIRILMALANRPEPQRTLARKCLTWVFYAIRPLFVTELIEAVAFDGTQPRENWKYYSEEDIIETCSNLIQFGADSVVRPLHYSITEFFTNREIKTLPEVAKIPQASCFFLSSETCHQDLVRLTFQYLQVLGSRCQSPCKGFFELWLRLGSNRFGAYTSRYFDIHLSFLIRLPEDIEKLLANFLASTTARFQVILQLRALNGLSSNCHSHFSPYNWELNVATVLQCTLMAQLPYFGADGKKWLSVKPLKAALLAAATSGALHGVARLIDIGHDVNEADPGGMTALYLATANNHSDVASFLISKGANVNAQGGHYGNPLQAAASNGNLELLRFLLENGADINAQGGENGSALQVAARFGELDTVRFLIENGADVNALGGKYGSALQAAAYSGKLDTVRFLVENGADVNALGGDYGSALQAAAYSGKLDTFRFLVEMGVDVNAQGGTGRSAFAIAKIQCYEDIARYLESKGASPFVPATLSA